MKISSEFKTKLAKARSLSVAGNYAQAEILYSELLSDGKEREGLLRELAQLYLQLQRIDEAIDCFAQLVQIAPEHWDYYLSGAVLSEKAGRLDKSIEFYSSLLKQNPNLPNTQYNLARLLKKVGGYQKAIDAYRQALKYGISAPEEVHSNLAVIYSELHKEEEAFAQLEQALVVNPNYIPALFNLAGLFEEAGQKEQALKRYQQILALDNHYYPALCRLVYMQPIVERRDPLIARVRLALSDKSIDRNIKEELYFALGEASDDCGLYDEAFQNYRLGNELGRYRFTPYDKESQERMVDEIIRQFDRVWFSGLQRVSVNKPIFICGMFRSGSTLVEQIVSGHSKVISGGELDFFPKLVDKLSQDYPGCLREYDEKWLDKVSADYCSFLQERFGTADLVTDKRPDNFLHLGLIKSVFPEARVIWTKRNLLDNCLSVYFQQLGGNMNYSVDLDFIGHYYSQQVRLMEHWKSLFPETVFEFSYEGLVKYPEDQVKKLLKFLGLTWEPSCLDFAARKSYVKTASIWQVRQSIYRKSVERYKKYERNIKILEKYLP